MTEEEVKAKNEALLVKLRAGAKSELTGTDLVFMAAFMLSYRNYLSTHLAAVNKVLDGVDVKILNRLAPIVGTSVPNDIALAEEILLYCL